MGLLALDFYEALSTYYDVIFPLNQQSISFIETKTTRGKLLDIASGTGNHALVLAKSGYEVTATDLDANMVNKMKAKAEQANVRLEALQLAMEDLDQLRDHAYSTIICLGNSLVHLKNIDDVQKALSMMYQLLLPKGKLFIQIVNYDQIISKQIKELPAIHREEQSISFFRTYKHLDNKIIFNGKLTINNETIENEVTLLPLTSSMLEKLVAAAGFSSIKLFGSFKGEMYENNSPAIIIEAIK